MPNIGPHVQLDNPLFIHETARLQGKVIVSRDVSVWTYATTRCERNEIRIGARTNIQDFVMIHEGAEGGSTIGEDCSITHHAVIHGCTIGDRCLIGINATVMDGAVIGDNSIVAGNAIVTEGAVFPENSIIGGVPAKLLATKDNSEANIANARVYMELAKRYAAGHERMFED